MKFSRIIAAVMALVIAPLVMVSPVSMAAIPGAIAPVQPVYSGEDADCALNPDENGSSVIHIILREKSSSDDMGVGSGEEDPDVTGTPIPHALFRLRGISQVGNEKIPDIDLLRNDEVLLEKAADLIDNIGTSDGAVTYDDTTKTAETNDQGEADFAELQYGLYEVEEIDATKKYTKVGKFYTVLPREVGNCWRIESFFYPKSEKKPTLEKTVKDDTATSIGSPISYTLEGSVTRAESGKYEISDQLSRKIKLKSVEVKLHKPGQQPEDAGTNVALAVDTDYTLEGAAGQVGQAVKVTLTAAGLAQLKTAYGENAETKVIVVINGEIAAIAGANNDHVLVSNKAFLIPNDSKQWEKPLDGETTPGVPSNEVVTKFGGIKIRKVDYLNNDTKLLGAKFKVYATKADAEAQEHELKFLNAEGTETTEAETDGEGNAIIEGLHVSDFANGKAAAQPTTYWVRETVAPEGYSVLPEPVEVTVASTADANNAGLVALTDKQIEDVAVNAKFRIPNTGLYGPFGYVLVGGLVIIIGAVVFIARRDR